MYHKYELNKNFDIPQKKKMLVGYLKLFLISIFTTKYMMKIVKTTVYLRKTFIVHFTGIHD